MEKSIFYVLPPPAVSRKIVPGKTPSPPAGGGGLGRGLNKKRWTGTENL